MPSKGSRQLPSDSTFATILADVKNRIVTAQARAISTVNAELVNLYWDIGRMIDGRQKREGWGTGVIPRLARELHNELPELKGFSERNIKLMLAFYREYPNPASLIHSAVAQNRSDSIVQQPVAQLQKDPFWSIYKLNIVWPVLINLSVFLRMNSHAHCPGN